jgi:hypothetical protein
MTRLFIPNDKSVIKQRFFPQRKKTRQRAPLSLFPKNVRKTRPRLTNAETLAVEPMQVYAGNFIPSDRFIDKSGLRILIVVPEHKRDNRLVRRKTLQK